MALNERLQILVTADGKGAVNEFSRIGAVAEKELGRTDDKLARLSSGLVSNGTQIALAGGIATAGVFALARAAGDYEEAASAAGVIFGDAAEDIEQFGKNAINSAGLSRRAAVEAANTFGTFGKAAGLTGDDLADFSTDLTQLAGDLASFKNTSTEDAITAIGAALRGESEPIRRYGVLLDDATLKQEALELGIYDGTGALDQQSKVLAAQAAIFKQTTDAQGDYQRTSESLSNQTRAFTAQVENLKVGLGEGAVPVFSELVGVANDALLSFQNLNPQTQDLVGRIGAIGAIGVTAVGGLTVLAGGALRVVDTISDLGGRMRDAEGNMTRVGQTAAVVGGALGAAGLALTVYQLAKAFNDATRDTVAFETALNDLRTASPGPDFDRSIAEGAEATAGKIDDLTDSVFRLTRGSDAATVRIGDFAVQIDNLDRYLQQLYETDPQELGRVLDRLEEVEAPNFSGITDDQQWDKLQDNITRYRENLESAARSSKTGFEQFRGGIDTYRQSIELTTSGVEDLASAADKANAELALSEALFGRAQVRAEGFLGAIEDSTAIDDLLGASLDLRDSSAALLDGIGALAGVNVQEIASGFGDISEGAAEALRDVLALGEDAQASIAAALQFQGADVARTKADDIRDGLVGVLDAAGVADDQIRFLLETIGLADWQIEASIEIAGEAEALATIQAFQQAAELLEAPIEIQAQVAEAQLEGRLGDAANLIDLWVQDRQDGLLTNPLLVAITLGDTEQIQEQIEALAGTPGTPTEIQVQVDAAIAEGRLDDAANLLQVWKEDQEDGLIQNPLLIALGLQDASGLRAQVEQLAGEAGTPEEIRLQVGVALGEDRLQDAANLLQLWKQDQEDGSITDPLLVAMGLGDTRPASSEVEAWKTSEEQKPPAEVPVGADTDPATSALLNLRQSIPLFGNSVRVDADTSPALTKLQQLQQAIPIFSVSGVGNIPGGFDTKVPVRGGGRDGNPATPLATGGKAEAGRDYFVNEPSLGGELFRPSTDGFVMNAADTDRLIRGVEALVGGGGGASYNINVSTTADAMATAEEIILAARAERHLVGAP